MGMDALLIDLVREDFYLSSPLSQPETQQPAVKADVLALKNQWDTQPINRSTCLLEGYLENLDLVYV